MEEPNFIDVALHDVFESADLLRKIVWDIPHERIFEASKVIDDAIATLMTVKEKLENRKQ